jgi:hypothetical protein
VTTTTYQSTIDIAEPGREVERAAETFVRGERGEFSPRTLANLQMAIELTLIVVPQCSRHHAERAVVDEFLIRIEAKLERVPGAAGILRDARQRLAQEFPTMS